MKIGSKSIQKAVLSCPKTVINQSSVLKHQNKTYVERAPKQRLLHNASILLKSNLMDKSTLSYFRIIPNNQSKKMCVGLFNQPKRTNRQKLLVFWQIG